jgi:hypothetical protein
MEAQPPNDSLGRLLRRLTYRPGGLIIDGLEQGGVVAVVRGVVTAIWAWRGHLGGVWLQRAIGALFAFFVMAFILSAVAIFRESAIGGHEASSRSATRAI